MVIRTRTDWRGQAESNKNLSRGRQLMMVIAPSEALALHSLVGQSIKRI